MLFLFKCLHQKKKKKTLPRNVSDRLYIQFIYIHILLNYLCHKLQQIILLGGQNN